MPGEVADSATNKPDVDIPNAPTAATGTGRCAIAFSPRTTLSITA
ncbi:uncharacterized protein RMCB_2746 [Mycolicibacterium brisbanense]|uniref:Uncharacterized protein n=1 Tax=Mycolicibacterium brisbanense TaxID=146020 RepID=A0A124DZW3_9MYCO|nr:uncharacterized protein RMCB_2746 [Mycolicibacterium brisbanense]